MLKSSQHLVSLYVDVPPRLGKTAEPLFQVIHVIMQLSFPEAFLHFSHAYRAA